MPYCKTLQLKSSLTWAGCRLVTVACVLLCVSTPAAAIKRLAFVTSVAGNGNLSSWADADGQTGIAAGNEICQTRAALAGLTSPNSFRAWLSTSTTDAYCNVQGLTGKKATNCNGQSLPIQGPWFFPGSGAAFAAGLTELTAPRAEIYRPISVDEQGDAVDGDTYWTGTLANGKAAALHCGDWTSASGLDDGIVGWSRATAVAWSDFGLGGCNQQRPLLCLQGLLGEAAHQPWSPASLVFVTSASGSGDLGSWPQAGAAVGTFAADNICRASAAEAHLPAPDSFVAWLSDPVQDASIRIGGSGSYRRVDGHMVAGSWEELTSGATTNSIHVDERGRYADANYHVWTGTNGWGLHESEDCSGWSTSSGGGVRGRAGLTQTAFWTEYGAPLACANEAHLYCFSNVITIFWDGFELTGDTSRWSSTAP